MPKTHCSYESGLPGLKGENIIISCWYKATATSVDGVSRGRWMGQPNVGLGLFLPLCVLLTLIVLLFFLTHDKRFPNTSCNYGVPEPNFV